MVDWFLQVIVRESWSIGDDVLLIDWLETHFLFTLNVFFVANIQAPEKASKNMHHIIKITDKTVVNLKKKTVT